MVNRDIPLYKVHMPAEMDSWIHDVLYSGQIASGPSVHKFEAMLQSYIGNPHITSCGDISRSLVLCLYMAGVRPGDEVIASPMACLATNIPILNLFAKVRWCDIDPQTVSLEPNDLERRITERTRAILIYHWAGHPSDLDVIYAVARRHRIKVVEDAGEAIGAVYNRRMIGNTGSDYTVFSFYPNRHITTIDGSAIAFASPDEYERGRWLKRYGIHQPSFRNELGEINPASDIPEAGCNGYLNNVAATLGNLQMNYLPEIVNKHRFNGRYYDEVLGDMPGITLLKRPPQSESAYLVYTMLAERRDDLLRMLRNRGIYASKVHMRNDHYKCFETPRSDLSGVSYFDQHTISIPCGWWVSEDDRDYIVRCIKSGW